MPMINITDYVPTEDVQFDLLIKELETHYTNKLFNGQTRLQRIKIVSRLKGDFFSLLQPHQLRASAYRKFQQSGHSKHIR